MDVGSDGFIGRFEEFLSEGRNCCTVREVKFRPFFFTFYDVCNFSKY